MNDATTGVARVIVLIILIAFIIGVVLGYRIE